MPDAAHARLAGSLVDRAQGRLDPQLEEFRWMIEELRVSLWAQQLKTPYPISFKRLEKYWREIG